MENSLVMAADSQSKCSVSESEVISIEETRQKTTHILNGLLETGECDVDSLYTVLKTLAVHTARLKSERYKCDKVIEAEHKLYQETKYTSVQLSYMSKVFSAAKQPKVWDHFTKAQRKKIESWQKEFEETNARYTEFLNFYDSDDACIPKNKVIKLKDGCDKITVINEIHKLRDEKKMLCQQLAAKNEEKKKLEHQLFLKKCKVKELEATESLGKQLLLSSVSKSKNVKLEEEAHIISLIAVFLNSHPFGANIHYICSYLNQFVPAIKARDIESLMKKFPSMFSEKSTGIGATLEKKWIFCDLKNI